MVRYKVGLRQEQWSSMSSKITKAANPVFEGSQILHTRGLHDFCFVAWEVELQWQGAAVQHMFNRQCLKYLDADLLFNCVGQLNKSVLNYSACRWTNHAAAGMTLPTVGY
eukprot:6464870-Amphidinium_carterae.1